jgi:hypothetical protein
MSHSDFDVVTGPSMVQRRAPTPRQFNKPSDPASGTGAEQAAQPEPADEKSLARWCGNVAASYRRPSIEIP